MTYGRSVVMIETDRSVPAGLLKKESGKPAGIRAGRLRRDQRGGEPPFENSDRKHKEESGT